MIEKNIETIKKQRYSFSKKQWILEAIEEKLEIEAQNIEGESQQLFQVVKMASEMLLKTPHK